MSSPPPPQGGTVTWPMNNKKSIGNHRHQRRQRRILGGLYWNWRLGSGVRPPPRGGGDRCPWVGAGQGGGGVQRGHDSPCPTMIPQIKRCRIRTPPLLGDSPCLTLSPCLPPSRGLEGYESRGHKRGGPFVSRLGTSQGTPQRDPETSNLLPPPSRARHNTQNCFGFPREQICVDSICLTRVAKISSGHLASQRPFWHRLGLTGVTRCPLHFTRYDGALRMGLTAGLCWPLRWIVVVAC